MKRVSRAGFTLIELAFVLGIVALLTHLAVREATQWRASRLHEAAMRGLEDIRDAVLGAENERDPDGRLTANGFLADMGRLPQTTLEVEHGGVERLTLAELWRPPWNATNIVSDVSELYDVRAATAEHLVAGFAADDPDPEVMVPGGWRGPYLRLKSGGVRLLDAWGNPYESPDSANHFGRLLAEYNPTNGWQAAVTVTGQTVVALQHFGADGQPDTLRTPEGQEEKDALLSFFDPWRMHYAPDNYTNATVHLALTLRSDEGAASVAGTFKVRVYSPYGGKILVRGSDIAVSSGSGNGVVTGLTPGLRILRVKGGMAKSMPRPILVKPGVNYFSEIIHVSD